MGVEVEEVDNHAFHGIHERVVAEEVARLLQASLHGLEVQLATLLLLRVEPHDGVLEKRELAPHAVVRLRRGHLDELLRHVDDIHAEVHAFLQVLHQVAPAGNNQAVARLETELPPVSFEGAKAFVAVGMAKIVGKLGVANPCQRMVYNNVLNAVHHQTVLRSSSTLISLIILNSQFFAHVEVVVEAVVVDINQAKSPIGGRHPERVEQVPARSPEVIRGPVEHQAIARPIELVITASDALVARLQQVLVLADHPQAKVAIHGDDELWESHIADKLEINCCQPPNVATCAAWLRMQIYAISS